MVLFDNLVVEKDNTYILFNMLSFRRKILRNDDYITLKNILNNRKTDKENDLIQSLLKEKQILTESEHSQADEIIKNDYFDRTRNKPQGDTVECIAHLTLSYKCNFDCIYCFEKGLTNKSTDRMTEEHIKGIKKFYDALSHKTGRNYKVTKINISGGEPLFEENLAFINYIAAEFGDAEISLLTNGANLYRYMDYLPLSKIKKFAVSLDGVKKVHMKRIYRDYVENPSDSTYEDIIMGIQEALRRKIPVQLSVIIDKNTFYDLPEFYEYLGKLGLTNNELVEIFVSPVLNNLDRIPLDKKFNSLDDIVESYTKLDDDFIKTVSYFPFEGLGNLFNYFNRKHNEEVGRACRRCNAGDGRRCTFDPNGKVYFCGCYDLSKGILGEYFPNTEINTSLIEKIEKRNIFSIRECSVCDYKYLCLTGCPLKALLTDGIDKPYCGVFKESRVMDNLGCFL